MRSLLLPPTEKRKQFELRALALRDFAGVTEGQRLDPFALAHFAKLLVVDFDQVEGLSAESRSHLLGVGGNEWSCGACSRPLPNGWRLVILNPAHGGQRNRATLMEEICHVFLGHTPNRLSIVAKDVRGRMMARDYRKADEEAAYGVGAAGLVPFESLKKLTRLRKTQEHLLPRTFRFHTEP